MKQSMLRAMPAMAATLMLASAVLAGPVFAKTGTEHLRGEISAVSESGFTVKTEDGSMRKVALDSGTKIAGVVPSSLDEVDKGTFIGTANVKHDGKAQALEVVVFPESMKGAGLGDYPWDLSPADVKGGDTGMSTGSGSSMTNGTVKSTGGNESGMSTGSGSSMTNGTVESSGSDESGMSTGSGSSMTNGTVKSTGGDESGMSMGSGSSMTNGTVTQAGGDSKMSVKVDYGKGSKTITIPRDVPVVALQKGSKSDIKKGEHVFVAGPQGTDPFQAKMILVGIDGTVPPM